MLKTNMLFFGGNPLIIFSLFYINLAHPNLELFLKLSSIVLFKIFFIQKFRFTGEENEMNGGSGR